MKGPGDKKKNIYEGEDFGPDAYPEGGKQNVGEEISPDNMKYAEPLMPIFGEEMVMKMFSKSWP